MIARRTVLSLAAAALVTAALASPAAALVTTPFTQVAFDAAKAAGKPVLVEVSAPWCPTCKAQKPILSDLRAMPKFKDLVIFEVDFDSQKEVLRGLNVQKQSTLVVFKGGKEVGRSTGDTKKESIEALLAKSVGASM
ncbi:MAG: thioredoxin family protein [Alsobacter sp.]|nr:thioredoxin family protein [Burkholderiales bacterium]